MELINECSVRFAEDKDFETMVGVTLKLAMILLLNALADCGQHHGSLPC